MVEVGMGRKREGRWRRGVRRRRGGGGIVFGGRLVIVGLVVERRDYACGQPRDQIDASRVAAKAPTSCDLMLLSNSQQQRNFDALF